MGEIYGKLKILKRVDAPSYLKDKRSIYYLCECQCGTQKIIKKSSLTGGQTKSCGCHRREVQSEKGKREATHGLSKTRFYRIWRMMRIRCGDTTNNQYHNYGGKGIKVCEEWQIFENFRDDMYQSYIIFEEKYGKDNCSIDRINSNGDYEPSNCRWATQIEQARNRANNIKVKVNGIEYRTLTEVAEAYNICYQTVVLRYHAGKREEELVCKPKNK